MNLIQENNFRDILNSDLESIEVENVELIWINLYESIRTINRWSGWYGKQYSNSYGGLSIYGNKIYLISTSRTVTFGTNNNDVLMAIIDLRTGSEISTKVYGSSTDDSALDIIANRFGVYIMANIGNGFKLNGSSDSYSTQNSNTNFALIFADYSGNIIEIESYETSSSSNSLGANYPKKLVITRQNKQDPFYSFISTRDDGTTNQGGGVYITKISNQQALFVTGNTNAAWNTLSPNCQLCHNQYCFKWLDGFLIQNGIWVASWSDHFYYQHDDVDNSKDINVWVPCYETCKTCDGTTKNSWLSWDTDKVFDSVMKAWKWNTGNANKLLGFNGVWVSDWDYGLTSTKQNEWFRACPEDSEDYSSSINISNAREKSTGINWYDLTKHLYFTSDITKGYKTYLYDHRSFSKYTVTFWTYITSTSDADITLIQFGKKLRLQEINYCLKIYL